MTTLLCKIHPVKMRGLLVETDGGVFEVITVDYSAKREYNKCDRYSVTMISEDDL